MRLFFTLVYDYFLCLSPFPLCLEGSQKKNGWQGGFQYMAIEEKCGYDDAGLHQIFRWVGGDLCFCLGSLRFSLASWLSRAVR